MTWILISAIIAEVVISLINRKIGAILGVIITAVITVFGIGVYAGGQYIKFFGIRIDFPIFMLICLAFLSLDVRRWTGLKKASEPPGPKMELGAYLPQKSEHSTDPENYHEALKVSHAMEAPLTIPDPPSEGDDNIIVASFKGNFGQVSKLLRAGADPNGSDAEGNTALMVAALRGDFVLVDFLLARGADPLKRNALGHSAAEYARHPKGNRSPPTPQIGHQPARRCQRMDDTARDGLKPERRPSGYDHTECATVFSQHVTEVS